MGKNRRYGSDVTDLAVVEAVIRPQPISLTPQEVGAENVQPASQPVDVDAWKLVGSNVVERDPSVTEKQPKKVKEKSSGKDFTVPNFNSIEQTLQDAEKAGQ